MFGKISATRMELLRFRRRLFLARRGHHLLKGKQDELLRRFLALLEEYFLARKKIHRMMQELNQKSGEAQAEVSSESLQTAVWPPPPEADLESGTRQILNLSVRTYGLRPPDGGVTYGPTELPAVYDELSLLWRKAAPLLVDLAEREHALVELADEIERTRRRVNALEHKLIPGLEEGIRTITFRLAEAELGNLTRLMRVKEIVRSA